MFKPLAALVLSATALSACAYVEREARPAPQAAVVVPQAPVVVPQAQPTTVVTPAPTVTVRP